MEEDDPVTIVVDSLLAILEPEPSKVGVLVNLAKVLKIPLLERIKAWRTDRKTRAELLEAARNAESCFISAYIDRKLDDTLAQAVASYPIYDNPTFQHDLRYLLDHLDEEMVAKQIGQQIRQGWPEQFSQEEINEGVVLYLDCLRVQLLKVTNFPAIVTGLAILRSEQMQREDLEISREMLEIIRGLSEALKSLAPPVENFAVSSNIPAQRANRYINRGRVENQVREILSQAGIAALVGIHSPGGTGKTALAIQASRELEKQFEAVLWIEVGKKSREQVITEMAAWCGFTTEKGQDVEQLRIVVHNFLGRKRILVVLDNVQRANSAHLAEYLPPSPPCAALVTSRLRNLGLPSKAYIPLGPMNSLQARQQLRSLLPLSWLKSEPQAAVSLIRLCKCNPLAIEIAARRIVQFKGMTSPIAHFVSRLEKRLAELSIPDDPRLDLFAVFDISYAELDEDQQRCFRFLSAFDATGFSPEAAAAIWKSNTPTAADLLNLLFQLSLIEPAPVGISFDRIQNTGRSSERYRLHDLLWEYAAEKLRHSEEEHQAVHTHAAYLLQLFSEHAQDDLSTAPYLVDEHNNLSFLANWAIAQKEGALLAALATLPRNWFYNIFRNFDEWNGWLEKALVLDYPDKSLRANVLKAIGDVQSFRKENEAALESYQQALALFKAVGDRLGEANVLQAEGSLLLNEQDPEQIKTGFSLIQTALEICVSIGDRVGQANIYIIISQWLARRAAYKEALPYAMKALEICKIIAPGHPTTLSVEQFVQAIQRELDTT